MIENFDDFWRIVLSAGLILFIMFFIYRKHIVHLFDPLVFYIISQAFSIELGFLIIDKTTYLVNFICCQVFFIAGFLLFAGKPPAKEEKISSRIFQNAAPLHISLIKWYAIITTLILMAANISQMKNTGIILFSDNPSEAKITSFTEGSGIIKRMNWGMLYLSGLSSLILLLYKKQLKYALLTLMILFILAMGGSKGALLYFVFSISLLSCFSDVKNLPVFKRIKLASFILLGIAVIIAGFIIYSSNSASSLNAILFSLVSRFLFFGDSIIYYYNDASVQYFSHYNIADYLRDDFNAVLGLLRIVPYSEQLGHTLVNYYFNIHSDTWGPSIPFYIKGNIYFGYYGSFIYSFIIGAIIGFVRSRFYKMIRQHGSTSMLAGVIVIHLNLMIYTLAQDSPVFISVLFDTVLLSVPAIVMLLYLHFWPKNSIAARQLN